MTAMGAVSAELHVYPDTEVRVEAFEATCEREPFVVLQVGAEKGRVVFFVADEEALNELACLVGQARAKLAGAVNRAKRAESAQPVLPELVARGA